MLRFSEEFTAADAAAEAAAAVLREDPVWRRYDDAIVELWKRNRPAHRRLAHTLRAEQEKLEADILDAASDAAALAADPYRYHGVSRSDF